MKSEERSSTTKSSFVNLFKLTVIVAFIKYELINQQQVTSAKSRGLIYNKDGKFIFRPPNKNHGHIIVIEDRYREREQKEAEFNRNRAAAETAYQPTTVQLISPRVYHPSIQHLASPIRNLYHPTSYEQAVQLINLNHLQGIGQLIPAAPATATATAAAPSHYQPAPIAASGPTLLHSQVQPPIRPYVQLYHQPVVHQAQGRQQVDYVGADSEYGSPAASAAVIATHQQLGIGHADMEMSPQIGQQTNPLETHYSSHAQEHNYYHQLPRSGVTEADSPIGSLDMPYRFEHAATHPADPASSMMDIPHYPQHHPTSESLMQMKSSIVKPRPQKFSSQARAQPELDSYSEVGGSLTAEYHEDHQSEQRPSHSSLGGKLWPKLGTERAKLSTHRHSSSAGKMDGDLEIGPSQKFPKRESKSLRSKSSSGSSKLIDNLVNLSPASDSSRDSKNNRYWSQFKDQYDIIT